MSGTILTSILRKLSTWTWRASSSSSATEEPSSAEQELHSLEDTMRRINAILDDAEEKGITDESEQLHLRELKEVAYDAEDVLDEYEYEVLRMKVEAQRWATASHMCNKYDKVTFDLNSFHPKVTISDELAGRIKEIRKRFEEINDWNRVGICLLEKGSKRRRIKKWTAETTSFFDEDKTYGRKDEHDEMIKWLLQEEEGDVVSIRGIVGMGGLGKTTLARMAYNDSKVRLHFNLRGWVYVSEDFNIISLAKRIYDSFGMYKNVDVTSLEDLHRELKVILKGKKFFLVLDDAWNLKFEHWGSLKTLLVAVGVGKILVTTRDERFAEIMQTTPPVYLSHLSFSDSWLLFRKIACEGRDHEFLEIGKKIVYKCKGLPLAIKVLAGILRNEDEEETWSDVLESELWELDKVENDDNIFPILKMSYDRLPVELRQCFMYLCLFPKGSCLERAIMVQQWISHGFIQSTGNKMEEDVGGDICNEFLNRSILHYFSKEISEDMFVMHDLMHDLAQSVAKDEYLLITSLKLFHVIPKTIRHVSLHIMDEDETINLEPLHEAKNLRTLLLSADTGFPLTSLLANLRRLRTLDLPWWGSHGKLKPKLPDSIGGLKHLRYLDIGCTESIPASVYNLHYLQTLKSENSMCEIKLSREVGGLVNLRHLYGFDEDHLPREVVALTNLQTLHNFTVGVDSDDMNRCKVSDLKRFHSLRGILNVRGLETVTWSDVTPPEAYLKSKGGLNFLRLFWESNLDEEVADEDERLAAQVLDCLQPHSGLREMSLVGYPGAALPAWLGHELPALENLVIEGMERVKNFVLPFQEKSSRRHNPPDAAAVSTEIAETRWWFPSLKELTLTNMHELEEWQGAEDSDPPCLRRLIITDCPKLRMLPSLPWLAELCLIECSSELILGCCCFPMLRRLEIIVCTSASIIFPSGPSLDPVEELTIMSCSALRAVEGLGGLASLRSLLVVDCPLLRISPEERLPVDIADVQTRESPGVDEWLRNQVLPKQTGGVDSLDKRKILATGSDINHKRRLWVKD